MADFVGEDRHAKEVSTYVERKGLGVLIVDDLLKLARGLRKSKQRNNMVLDFRSVISEGSCRPHSPCRCRAVSETSLSLVYLLPNPCTPEKGFVSDCFPSVSTLVSPQHLVMTQVGEICVVTSVVCSWEL